MLLTNHFTTAPIAPAIITATANSITFPPVIKSLNSLNILIYFYWLAAKVGKLNYPFNVFSTRGEIAVKVS